jgi:hypothetical protein
MTIMTPAARVMGQQHSAQLGGHTPSALMSSLSRRSCVASTAAHLSV